MSEMDLWDTRTPIRVEQQRAMPQLSPRTERLSDRAFEYPFDPRVTLVEAYRNKDEVLSAAAILGDRDEGFECTGRILVPNPYMTIGQIISSVFEVDWLFLDRDNLLRFGPMVVEGEVNVDRHNLIGVWVHQVGKLAAAAQRFHSVRAVPAPITGEVPVVA